MGWKRTVLRTRTVLWTRTVLPGLGLLLATALSGQEESAPPPLALEEVLVTPTKPGVETLCQLTVRLRNNGEKPASVFAFEVKVAGHELPVYRNQVFLETVAPGKSLDLRLYNFWTSETGRPAPTDGKLPVVVTLTEANWVEETTEEDGTFVTTVGEAVPGLPVTAQKTLPMASP